MAEQTNNSAKNPEHGPKSPEMGTGGSSAAEKDESDSDSKDSENKGSAKSEKKEQRRAERSERRASFFSEKQTTDSGETKSAETKITTDSSDANNTVERDTSGPIDVVERANAQEEMEASLPGEEYAFDEAEELSEQEVHDVIDGLVESRTHDVAHELEGVPADSAEEFEAIADAAFLESLRERVDGAKDLSEDVLDEAFAEALQDLSLENDDNIAFDSDADAAIQRQGDVDGLEATNGAEDSSPVVQVQTTKAASQLPQTPSAQAAGAGNAPPNVPGGPNVPGAPNLPLPPPGGPNGPLPPPNGGSPPPPVGPNYNTLASSAAPNVAPSGYTATDTDRIMRRRRRRHLLTGALVGYVVGRRGGRKRTEKRLAPKLEKLEKQVSTLHDAVSEREEKIRAIARKSSSKIESSEIPEKKSVLKERRIVRKEIRTTLEHRDEIAHSKPEAVTELGKLNLVSAEVFHEKRVYKELVIDGKEAPRKSVEVMTKDELLIVIGDLEYNGVKVRDMVVSGRLEVKALREIVKQYMRGEKAGAGERFEKTILRELKPDPSELESKRTIIEKLHLGHPIERAAEHMRDLMPASLRNSKLPIPMFQGQASEQGTREFRSDLETASGRKKRNKSPSPFMPVWVVIIVTVVVIALLLLITGT